MLASCTPTLCEWCREEVLFFDAKTGSGRATWHTRCWNEAAEQRALQREEAGEDEREDEASLTMGRWSRPESGLRRSEESNNMATAQPRTPREVVEFASNVPVTVSLKYGQGKTVSSQYGERVMYSLVDGRVMFLDLATASQIEHLAINVQESFTITKRPGLNGGPVTWEVARIAGEQPNGTLLVPAFDTPAPKPPAMAVTAGSAAPRKPPASTLVDEANALVDSFAQVLERSLTQYQGRIKPDEVKTLFVTAYIQRRQFSSVA